MNLESGLLPDTGLTAGQDETAKLLGKGLAAAVVYEPGIFLSDGFFTWRACCFAKVIYRWTFVVAALGIL